MPISVQKFRDECSAPLRLRLVAGEAGLAREVADSHAREAGLAVTGEVSPHPGGRVLLLGEAEMACFLRLESGRQAESADRFFAGPFPCAVVSASRDIPPPSSRPPTAGRSPSSTLPFPPRSSWRGSSGISPRFSRRPPPSTGF